jgi:hypothetical protein
MTPSPEGPRGLCTLASEGVLEWAVALLESVREHEPTLPVCVIPFDDGVAALRPLASRYRCTVLEDPALGELEALGRRFAPDDRGARLFRKLAAFAGPFERFAFCDADLVLLAPLGPLFDAYECGDHDLLASDLDLDQVYKPGPFRERMAREGAPGLNTGCFVARRGLLSPAELPALADEAEGVRQHFVASNGEQPFVDFCVHRKRLSVAAFADVLPGTARWTWAGRRVTRDRDGLRVAEPWKPDHGGRLPVLHWAGLRPRGDMPNARVFLRYRLRSLSPARRLLYLVRWWAGAAWRRPAGSLVRAVRRLRARPG